MKVRRHFQYARHIYMLSFVCFVLWIARGILWQYPHRSTPTTNHRANQKALSIDCLKHPARIFVDLGSNDGQSIEWEVNRVTRSKVKQYDAVISFEMNPLFWAALEIRLESLRKKGMCTRLYKGAAFTKEAKLTANLNTPDQVTVSRSSGLVYNMTGSSIFDRREYHCDGGSTSTACKKNGQKATKVEVDAFNIPALFLDMFEEKDHVFVKMDIEGAEYTVLEHLINSTALCRIDELAIEWHGEKGLVVDKTGWKEMEENTLPAAAATCGTSLRNWDL